MRHYSGDFDGSDPPSRASFSRRAVVGSGLAAGFCLAGCQIGADRGTDVSSTAPTTTPDTAGALRQAGVATPAVRPAFLELVVADVSEPRRLGDLLPELGAQISTWQAVREGLTATVGLGPTALAALGRRSGPGTSELPRFDREDISSRRRGGQVLLQICSGDAAEARGCSAALLRTLGSGATSRWRIGGFRGSVDGSAARNLLGFHDGVSVPQTTADLDEAVWLPGPGPLAGGTLAVVRQMSINVSGFEALPVAQQERAIGRVKSTGAPLSGGTLDDQPDLQAKSAAGVYDIAVDAHVRRAHPLAAGVDGLMLRRSYSYRTSTDSGLVFIAFMRDLDMFIRTQQRMDELDALMPFTRTTASASFLILPGFDATHPLGSTLAS